MKRFLVFIIAAVAVFSFAGCSADYEQNAIDLVEANLNVVYRGECTEEYASVVGMTVEETKVFYEDGLLYNAELLMNSIQIEYQTEEITEKYVDIFRKLFKKLDYSILDAEQKDENTVIVTIEVYPVDIAEELEKNLETEIAILDIQYADVDFAAMSEEEYIAYDHAWANAVARSFSNANFVAKTGEAVIIEVEVIYDETFEGWQISDKSIEEIEKTAFVF